MPRYINPYTDFGFKKLFGEEANKDLLIDFLNAVLPFLQMPLFTKTESELETQKDKWLFFLKNLESFDDIPEILHDPVFEKAFATAEYVKYSPEMQEAYQNDLKAYRDNRNVLETARIEGEAIGEARGEAKGEAKGRAGREIEIAWNMKRKGLDSALIAEMTGLSPEEIKQLKQPRLRKHRE